MSRILFVEANEDGTVGGSHKILADTVLRLSPRYHPVVLFYQNNVWADRLQQAGVEVVCWDDVRARERVKLKEGGRLSTAWGLAGGIALRRRFLLTNDIALVHLNNSPIVGHDDWLPAARLAGKPCVVYGMGDARVEPNALRRFLICRYDAYFPLSKLVWRALKSNGVDEKAMDLTYPGVDTELQDRRTFRLRKDVRAEFGLGERQLLVVMVGNIREWKGQHVVVEALSRLQSSSRSRLKILLVGEVGEHTAYQEALSEAIQRYGLADIVSFAGRREDVPDLLEAADIAIHASISPEPFGLVVQEAMLHGCATIAANQGGPAEMLTTESGIMFDPAHPEELTGHIETLIEDRALRLRLAEAARQHIRDFDVHRHVGVIEARYDRLLGGRGIRVNERGVALESA